MKVVQFLHTVRHLRAQQIFGQIAHRSRYMVRGPERVLTWSIPEEPKCRWSGDVSFLPPPPRNSAADLLDGRFRFVNRIEMLRWPPKWNRDGLPLLWLYNLHYFDFLWALDFADARNAVIDWIEKHSPVRGRVGWQPYPISLRLMNWCMCLFGRFQKETSADSEFRQLLWPSVYRQMRWLTENLETHLLGNHYFENAAAMALVGSCFDGPIAAGWLQQGMALLKEQLLEQVLPDGGHFERSPMYHARIVHLLMILKQTGNPELAELVWDALDRASDALSCMTHPDGEIALLNDSAFGVYHIPMELFAATRGIDLPKAGAFGLHNTGYFGARSDDGSYVIFDAAPIGPDYQPGHAHGDTLSFELSLRGHRVIVDSGVFNYEPGEMRQYCRSTRAHNTVEIDGQDQSEFWDTFRVARRANVRDVRWTTDDHGVELVAAHDGYSRLSGAPIHQRTFIWNYADGLTLKDEVTNAAGHQIISRQHLHPDCQIQPMSNAGVRVNYPAGSFDITVEGSARLEIEDSYYCPRFGERLANKSLAWHIESTSRTCWTTHITPSADRAEHGK